ncbi:MAG: hypothetical protein E7319_10905 [Clostridiales bacterium]|nr:hypothetical protein [Clostridiales bacterium]
MTTFEKARQYVYRCARPVELARWQYHFEGGSKENVLLALSFYQNEDGGFGHGLEADSLNPASSPITTLTAADILDEIGFTDASHPIIQGMLRYLDSGDSFDTQHNQWLNTIPSNNDYPHACWWEYDAKDESRYNPTAGLAAFILRYADPASALYRKGLQISKEAVAWFLAGNGNSERHVVGCFVPLYHALKYLNIPNIDMDCLAAELQTQVHQSITQDTSKWAVEYATKPSAFRITPDSMFYEANAEVAQYECQFIQETQQADGSWPITWQWWNDYKEYTTSTVWWRAVFCIENMLYLKAYGQLENA